MESSKRQRTQTWNSRSRILSCQSDGAIDSTLQARNLRATPEKWRKLVEFRWSPTILQVPKSLLHSDGDEARRTHVFWLKLQHLPYVQATNTLNENVAPSSSVRDNVSCCHLCHLKCFTQIMWNHVKSQWEEKTSEHFSLSGFMDLKKNHSDSHLRFSSSAQARRLNSMSVIVMSPWIHCGWEARLRQSLPVKHLCHMWHTPPFP